MEMVPFGQEARQRTIGTLEIGNITADFMPDDDRGEYRAVLNTDRMQRTEVKFFNWPRRLGCWALLQAILQLIHKPIPIDYQKARYVDEDSNEPERLHDDGGCRDNGGDVTCYPDSFDD